MSRFRELWAGSVTLIAVVVVVVGGGGVVVVVSTRKFQCLDFLPARSLFLTIAL